MQSSAYKISEKTDFAMYTPSGIGYLEYQVMSHTLCECCSPVPHLLAGLAA